MTFLQQHMASLHTIFQADVAARMGMDKAAPQTWGDGQVFLAGEAHALGLVTGLVTDRAALIDHIIKEISMDLKTLAEAHPELLAAIRADAVKEAEAASQTAMQNAVSTTAESYIGLIHAVAGKDVADKVELLAKINATPEQIAAFADVFGAGLSDNRGSEQSSSCSASRAATAASGHNAAGQGEPENPASPRRRHILDAIRGATPGPVNTSAKVDKPDETQAAIDRISAL